MRLTNATCVLWNQEDTQDCGYQGGAAVASGVRSVLIDAARTTRKYGLGWMFISQTLSSLHWEILHQLRISFFGFGLALGSEF